MASSLEESHKAVVELVQDFERHKQAYFSQNYSEAQARQDFVDKFFTAIGWDVAHNIQKNPFEQEVKVENKISIGNTQRRADYAFYVKPNFRDVRFFVEAKKPCGLLATPDNYFQTIRYGWNSSTPLAVLTDFESLHVLDCRYKPDIDTALERVAFKFFARDFLNEENFAKVYFLLSREAVGAGAIESQAILLPKKRGKAIQRGLFKGGYQGIDDAFLQELDSFRDSLARNFKMRNTALDGVTLTEITQRTLDRLVFLRFLEDKLIETSESVANFGSKGSVWGDFVSASKRLNSIYNGIVFKHHSILDSPDFAVDDDVFGNICESLADVNSPYNFDAVPIHILGSIYERFLGKVIVATDKRARVEEKPEVRKAGGVYYTPVSIVRYIVENSIGALVGGKNPGQIAEMRFADIACGSGSFLLGVYDYLLRYHRDWYNANPTKTKNGDCQQHADGTLHLTLRKKREILLNNIYGVDIDHQAVEVAQLSLYLKLLEEETTSTARNYQLELHETILPTLTKNIVCGNSLIGNEIFDGQLFTSDLQRKINPLDFDTAFAHIKKRGGFDAIVGNPPYVNAWDFFENQPEVRDYLNKSSSYTTADRHWDLYVLFIERALQLIRNGGFLSYIIPYTYALQKYAMLSRRLLLTQCTIQSIADVRTVQAFKDVPVITMIPVIVKSAAPSRHEVVVLQPQLSAIGRQIDSFQPLHTTSQRAYLKQHEMMLRLDLSKEALSLVKKVAKMPVTLGDLCYINYGAQMSSKVKGKFGKDHVIRDSNQNKSCKPMISGKELYRYDIRYSGRYVDWAFADQMYGPRWEEFFELPKLMIRDITGTHRIESTFDDRGFYCDHTILCALRKCDVAQWKPASPAEVARTQRYDLRFLAAILGSSVVSAYFYLALSGEGVRTGGGFHTYPESIRAFPIPSLDQRNGVAADIEKKLISLVDQMLEFKATARNMKSDKEIAFVTNRIVAIERQIDNNVFQLFDLNDDEIDVAIKFAGPT